MRNFVRSSLPKALMKLSGSEAESEDVLSSLQKELEEKLYTAEYYIAVLRFLVTISNTLIYLFLMDKSHSIPALAWFVIVTATLYALVVIIFKPYRKYQVLLASFYISGTDAVFISLWILATGGFYSPFYLVWYVSIVAIALRYSHKVTIRTAVIYSILYIAVISFNTNILIHLDDVLARVNHLLLISVMASLLSREVLNQINAKVAIKKSEEELRKRELALKEMNDQLEDRIKERTAELDNSNKALLRINEDLDNFVYATSHDLKSPIMNMEALVSIAFQENAGNGPERDEAKSRIYNSLNRMKGTINQLAQVAKAQKEVYTDIESINFSEITNEVIADNEELIKKAGATIETDFAAATISLSRTGIKSILYNFISNAIKYRSADRQAHIKVKTLCSEKELMLSVEDNGLGIDLEKNRDKLFTIFKRFHDHVEGAGIGLYMVKHLIEKNNGRIEVESEVGKGSVFRAIFPMVAEDRGNTKVN